MLPSKEGGETSLLPEPRPASEPNTETQMIKKNYDEVVTIELQTLSLLFLLMTE